MSRRATKPANISVTLYDGDFEIYFDCAGVDACKFALCATMPPTGDDDCCYQNTGSCRFVPAQEAALQALKKRITKELKKLSQEDD